MIAFYSQGRRYRGWISAIILGLVTPVILSAAMDSESVTRVEKLDLQSWMSGQWELDGELFGEWVSGDAPGFRIHSVPLAANTCLVEWDGRMVPGFQVENDGKTYLVVGVEASEEMELIPTVFLIVRDDSGSLRMDRLQWRVEHPSFPGYESFEAFLSGDRETKLLRAKSFHRI